MWRLTLILIRTDKLAGDLRFQRSEVDEFGFLLFEEEFFRIQIYSRSSLVCKIFKEVRSSLLNSVRYSSTVEFSQKSRLSSLAASTSEPTNATMLNLHLCAKSQWLLWHTVCLSSLSHDIQK